MNVYSVPSNRCIVTHHAAVVARANAEDAANFKRYALGRMPKVCACLHLKHQTFA